MSTDLTGARSGSVVLLDVKSGEVLANVYFEDRIARIDPESGRVLE